MKKRGLAAIALALVAAVPLGGTADARAGRLSYSAAKGLARALARTQVERRHLVSYHLYGARRLGPNKIAFRYDDRSRNNVYCTAVVLVTRRTSGATTRFAARFRGQHCAPIPADALAIESLTRRTVRAIRRNQPASERALTRFTRQVIRCRRLHIPRNRSTAASAILEIAFTEALERPNDGELGDFAAALASEEISSRLLRAGVAGWTDYLAVVRALPPIPDFCATLKRWARAGWSTSERPIDLAAFRVQQRRLERDERAIERASLYLAEVGVFPRTAAQFMPEFMLLGALIGEPFGVDVVGLPSKPAVL